MSRKGWLLILISVLVLLSCALVWLRELGVQRPVVVFPGGSRYQFHAVTYGTNHTATPVLGRILGKLPSPAVKFAQRILGPRHLQIQRRTTSTPSYCVWFEPLGTNAAPGAPTVSVHAMLFDESGFAGGGREHVSIWAGALNPQWPMIDFKVFPKRSRNVECRFFQYGTGSAMVEVARVRFRNPFYEEFPQWQPEPLPVAQPAGDLDATLLSFRTGHSSWSGTTHFADGRKVVKHGLAIPGQEVSAVFELDIQSPRGESEAWALKSAQVSDATGNSLRATSWGQTDDRIFRFSPVLWPDEAAWKLNLELKRSKGFLENELITFKDVPVPGIGMTNLLSLSRQHQGVDFELKHFIRRPDLKSDSWSSHDLSEIRLQHTAIPDHLSLDFVEITGPDGAPVPVSGRGWSGDYYDVSLRTIPAALRTVDITYVLQSTRAVEFLVKPELAVEEETEDRP